MHPSSNPYDWQHHEPAVEVPRTLVQSVVAELLQGAGAVVIGGRGMGKSVLLRQVRGALESSGPVRVVSSPSPPQSLSAQDCLETLAEQLDEPVAGLRTSHELCERYFRRRKSERLVLLYDEFDRYARAPAPNAPVPGRLFFNDLETARRSFPQLGILAVGTLGVFVFRDVLGSSFLSRAARFWMRPFTDDEARRLALPFAERGQALADDVLATLVLAGGGNPALLTYGLQELWPVASPSERDVAHAYTRFQTRYGEFLSDVVEAFSDPALSRIPQRVWELIRARPGEIERATIEEVCRTSGGALRLTVADVLQLLEAAGVVRIDGSAISDDPLVVYPVAGLLGLPAISPPAPGFAERLWRDLATLLAQLFAASADFFRPGAKAGQKRLVPESVFTAFLALGLGLLGWQVEREAQQAAGRTDLKLRRNGSAEVGIVEVKIWGRPGSEDAHRQVAGYWTPDVAAGAVVMLTDADISDWPEAYRRKCLEPRGVAVEEVASPQSATRARFRASSLTPEGLSFRVEHFLVRLPRGAAR
jgi:energy-coupling factor transporter ATP-binding protein EcfA2